MKTLFQDLSIGDEFYYEGSTYIKDTDTACFKFSGFMGNDKANEVTQETEVTFKKAWNEGNNLKDVL